MSKKGFTLAEILITLTVIGVVAALTIPNLLQNSQNSELKTAWRKAYADLSQAFITIKAEGVSTEAKNSWDTTVARNIFTEVKNRMQVIKDCDNMSDTTSNCWATGELIYANPRPWSPSFIDNTGRSWALYCDDDHIKCGTKMLVDTNGFKMPNKIGRDRFFILLATLSGTYTGELIRILPLNDVPAVDASTCPSGGCYTTSWLYN